MKIAPARAAIRLIGAARITAACSKPWAAMAEPKLTITPPPMAAVERLAATMIQKLRSRSAAEKPMPWARGA